MPNFNSCVRPDLPLQNPVSHPQPQRYQNRIPVRPSPSPINFRHLPTQSQSSATLLIPISSLLTSSRLPTTNQHIRLTPPILHCQIRINSKPTILQSLPDNQEHRSCFHRGFPMRAPRHPFKRKLRTGVIDRCRIDRFSESGT